MIDKNIILQKRFLPSVLLSYIFKNKNYKYKYNEI